jgi:glycosyltransferase involved in cell wall biosynthesis
MNVMRIAQVAPLIEPVPPRLYGGTERVVSYLTEELVGKGHDVTLFASGDSKTAARLLSVIPHSIRLDHYGPDPYAYQILELTDVLALADEFDIIHSHLDYLAFPFCHVCGTPIVHTLHGRTDYPYSIPMMQRYSDLALVSISNSQRRPLAGLELNWMDTVYHGMPESKYGLHGGEDGYLAYYSRLSREKRPDLAIEVARKVGIPLKMAGKVDKKDREYFNSEIRPMIDGDPLIEFIGEIGEGERPQFLGNARALLFPIEWPEPFGLVMIEAMAVGTPVISRPFGAVPEVVEDGVTGFVCGTFDELVEAARKADGISREGCMLRARERFSVTRMAEQYQKVYQALVNQEL